MKRLAVFLAAVLIVGWVSPSLADDLNGKTFYVRLLDEDGNVIDDGKLEFGEAPAGHLRLWHSWYSDGLQKRWRADRDWCAQAAYGDYGCEFGAWDPPGGEIHPYGEFEAFYSKDWYRLFGHCEDRSGTKYSLYAEPWYRPTAR